MSSKKIIIKFETVCDQNSGAIRRLVGFVKGKYLIDLIATADLSANPRKPKVGGVTKDITESIEKTPAILPFKTKGILLAVHASPEELERQRYKLEFHNDGIDGILDGGHNALAIAMHILNEATAGLDKGMKKIKTWDDLRASWAKYAGDVAKKRQDINFLVPIEVLMPANDAEEVQNEFKESILDICAARNNNVQLMEDTKANQAGHYEEIKKIVDVKIRDQIVWKTGELGRIKARDIVALAWIPLMKLGLHSKQPVSPVQLYSSKGKCMERFIALMKGKGISNLEGGKYELISPNVESALALLKELPELYDLIYQELPAAYNQAGGKFGRITAVKEYGANKGSKKPQTPFYAEEVEYSIPEGFIMPLVYALSALMEVQDGKVRWKVNPSKFVKKNLAKVVANFYKPYWAPLDYDPQKVGKNAASYHLAKQQFENCLIRNE